MWRCTSITHIRLLNRMRLSCQRRKWTISKWEWTLSWNKPLIGFHSSNWHRFRWPKSSSLHWLLWHLNWFRRIISISAIDIERLLCVKALVKSTIVFIFVANADECPKCISIYSVISRFAFHVVNDPAGICHAHISITNQKQHSTRQKEYRPKFEWPHIITMRAKFRQNSNKHKMLYQNLNFRS